MTTINLTSYCKRNEDGSINLEATCEAFAGDLIAYKAECETEAATIADAVNAVLDKHQGTHFNMPAIVSYTLQELNAQPASFKALTLKVQSYLRENSGERESGKPFHIGKGKGGGFVRWADVPVEAPKA